MLENLLGDKRGEKVDKTSAIVDIFLTKELEFNAILKKSKVQSGDLHILFLL